MVRPRSASVFWPLDLLVCINLSGLLLELCVLLAMMGSARPRPVKLPGLLGRSFHRVLG